MNFLCKGATDVISVVEVWEPVIDAVSVFEEYSVSLESNTFMVAP